ncbi:MAG: molybdopterin-binding protein [Silicimonas sp.]
MTDFDTFLVVDWSAAKAKSARPQTDAIWFGIARRDGKHQALYLRSRMEAERHLSQFFDQEMSSGRRVLAAFDFPFGYPQGFARHVTGSDDPLTLWDWLEERIVDTPDGENNRFEIAQQINALFPDPGPFWGRHAKADFPGVPYRKETVRFTGFAEKRETDVVARSASSCFQLAFPPTVGGQVLTGLPVLARLRRKKGVMVWPYEEWRDAPVVLAEVWPGLVDRAVRASEDRIRDRAQVALLSKALSLVPPDSLESMMQTPPAAREEAWILGGEHSELLEKVLAQEKPDSSTLVPPRLKNDCFALPPGVDWTPVDTALTRLRKRLHKVVGTESIACQNAGGRILAMDAIARRSNPPAANSAVDGYGFAHAATGSGDTVLPLLEGRAAAGAPYDGRVPTGHAIRILTGALLPKGVDTVVLEEDCSTDGRRVAFEGPVRQGANTRRAGEDVVEGGTVLASGTVLGPPELAVLAATGITELTVFKPLRVGVLSTGDEIAAPGSTEDPARTYDANRPMLLQLLRDWRMQAIDLGHIEDDRRLLKRRLDQASRRCDAILTSGGASAGDEDHVSALLGETGSRADWRIALKPGRPLALGMWQGVPVFGLPGNPVAALVCTLIFARPALGLMRGEGWKIPTGFDVPAAFSKSKKPGRREYLRARIDADGAVSVFPSEGSGRISGLAWADGLVEIGDEARQIGPGDLVRYIPFSSFL